MLPEPRRRIERDESDGIALFQLIRVHIPHDVGPVQRPGHVYDETAIEKEVFDMGRLS